jgi:hypothetical protein
MKNIDFKTFLNEVQQVFKHPRPWMHIRYGDGEGIVLGYPGGSTEQKARERWKKWLGPESMSNFTTSHLQTFSSNLRQIASEADILGIPCLRHMKVNQDWRNVSKYLREFCSINENQRICCMDYTVDLQRKNLYFDLLNGKDEIFYISCRNMEVRFKRVFNIKKVTGYHLPLQYNPCRGKSLTSDLHFPTCYNLIMKELQADLSGKIFLVGAGGLGKTYCAEIKRHGGVALDVGSLFDGWSGMITRSYLNNIKDYIL